MCSGEVEVVGNFTATKKHIHCIGCGFDWKPPQSDSKYRTIEVIKTKPIFRDD
jgi:hypothetical protein